MQTIHARLFPEIRKVVFIPVVAQSGPFFRRHIQQPDNSIAHSRDITGLCSKTTSGLLENRLSFSVKHPHNGLTTRHIRLHFGRKCQVEGRIIAKRYEQA